LTTLFAVESYSIKNGFRFPQ